MKSQVGIFPDCLFIPEFAVKRLGKNSFYMETEEGDGKNVLDYLKGKLKYENTAEAAEDKDRIRQIIRTQTDDLPTRKAMWEVLNSVANIGLFIFFLMERCLVQIHLP